MQGGDPFAPPTIDFWVEQARSAARKEEDPEKAKALFIKATSAEQVAWAFRAYQRGEGAAQIEHDKRIEADLSSDRNIILARGADRLNNAVAETIDLADRLQEMADFVTVRGKLREAAEILRACSNSIEPRRAMQKRDGA